MDNNRLTCQICLESFDEDSRCPRMLHCGHTFCHSCLTKLMKQCLRCPTCKGDILYPSVNAIPVNFCAKDLVSEMKVNSEMKVPAKKLKRMKENKQPRTRQMSKKLPSEGFCEEHNHDMDLKCMDCKIWVCGMCATLKHRVHRVLLVEEALLEMKAEYSKRVAKELQIEENKIKSVEKKTNDLINEIVRLEGKLAECEKGCRRLKEDESEAVGFTKALKKLESSVAESCNHDELSNALKMIETSLGEAGTSLPLLINATFTVKDLEICCQAQAVYIVRTEGTAQLHAKVSVLDGNVLICAFQTKPPEGRYRIIPMDNLLRCLNVVDLQPANTRRGFMRLCDMRYRHTFVIVLRIEGRSQRGKNVLLLCSGVSGESYKGTKMSCENSMFFLEGYIPPMEGDDEWESLGVPLEKGMLLGMPHGPRFKIVMYDDYPTELYQKVMGRVTLGLEELEFRCKRGRCFEVVDCGLVF